METISVKMDSAMLKNIDSKMLSHNFSTRTEFIRTAIRDKLQELTREDAIKLFMSMQGKFKRTTTKSYRQIRDEVVAELEKELYT